MYKNVHRFFREKTTFKPVFIRVTMILETKKIKIVSMYKNVQGL